MVRQGTVTNAPVWPLILMALYDRLLWCICMAVYPDAPVCGQWPFTLMHLLDRLSWYLCDCLFWCTFLTVNPDAPVWQFILMELQLLSYHFSSAVHSSTSDKEPSHSSVFLSLCLFWVYTLYFGQSYYLLAFRSANRPFAVKHYSPPLPFLKALHYIASFWRG